VVYGEQISQEMEQVTEREIFLPKFQDNSTVGTLTHRLFRNVADNNIYAA